MQTVLLLYREKKYQTETTQKEEIFSLPCRFRGFMVLKDKAEKGKNAGFPLPLTQVIFSSL